MPSKPRTVTPAAVFSAAAQLVARGHKPTNAAIRAMLGGGSYSSIAPLLKQWHLQQAMGTAVVPASGDRPIDAFHGKTLAAMAWLRAEVAALRQQLQQAEATIQSLAREHRGVVQTRTQHSAPYLPH